MKKSFNLMKGGYERALANLRRHEIRVYATFILGYDEDGGDTLEETLAFAERHRFYIVAFNHLTPFPGTPLYQRLQSENRLLYERWWLDPAYRYGMVPFAPRGMTADEVKQRCIDARQRFYGLGSILRRARDFNVTRRSNWFMLRNFLPINLLFRGEVMQRKDFPLGDEAYTSPLLKAEHADSQHSVRVAHG
jgi:radical SAM superfamily enzyme YgiQ (UPF0313 family)